MLTLITLLLIKHFLIDFPLQKPYQWKNKGTYGHLGGILHAALHSFGTMVCILLWNNGTHFNPLFLNLVSVAEFVLHYHIDWAKMNINKFMGWKCDKHEEFWNLTGLDQLLHQLTYVGVVWACFKYAG